MIRYRTFIGRITPHARPERPVRQSTPLGAWTLITAILAGLLCGGLAYCKRKVEPRVITHTVEIQR